MLCSKYAVTFEIAQQKHESEKWVKSWMCSLNKGKKNGESGQ